MAELPRGLYEVLLTELLEERLRNSPPAGEPEITDLRMLKRRIASRCTSRG